MVIGGGLVMVEGGVAHGDGREVWPVVVHIGGVVHGDG